tara:strand:+ start:52 stop:438 length:387 start_codon:yes stop_codon:yes gene_type:complete
MNIYGLGIDIINIERFKNVLLKKKSLKKRIFTTKEITYCSKKKNNISCFAMRFAAKEAFSKALGTGISKGISFNEIEISNNKIGKPSIKLKGVTLKIVQKILKKRLFKIVLSISDDKPFAVASVILSN